MTIRRTREAKKLTQLDLAKRAGVSEKLVRNVEKGENTSFDTYEKLATVLDLEITVTPLASETGHAHREETPVSETPSPTAYVMGALRIIDATPNLVAKRVEAFVTAGPAGVGRWDDAKRKEFVELPGFILTNPEWFVVQAIGDSMLDEEIADGDYIVVERRAGVVGHNEMVIAWLNDDLLIKRLFCRGGKKVLESHHDGWLPHQIIDGDDFEVQAVVRYIVKK